MILLAPEDGDREAKFSVMRLDFIGIALIHLGDLPIECRLPLFTDPWRRVNAQSVRRERVVCRTFQVGVDHRFMYVSWHTGKRGFMCAHMANKW